MKRFVCIYLFCLFITLTGCQKDKPKPETRFIVESLHKSHNGTAVPVIARVENKSNLFYVNHQVKGKNVFIECMVQSITFRDTNSPNKGKIVLYVDGKKKEEISSAAFIVKGLSAGTHRIKLEIVKESNPTPMMKKEFYVTIP